MDKSIMAVLMYIKVRLDGVNAIISKTPGSGIMSILKDIIDRLHVTQMPIEELADIIKLYTKKILTEHDRICEGLY